jgi:hypothetical protein
MPEIRVNGWVSRSCAGEWCRCGRTASHKIGEVIMRDDPNPDRHELTVYQCCVCFRTTVLTDQCGHTLDSSGRMTVRDHEAERRTALAVEMMRPVRAWTPAQ